ncbi:LamG-like jellyroll fold domain-containing protein [Cerasicoccus fimbriatus]|uniref:LamG-like jellyroll fold domain-containing protein n=1 Tax=Cerasicoccus fimbriatus TaxID=3014554 RepID=UPI0022B3EE92|nr:LamG-like jellyroll fold domain-containing protein [Cerasicoccus sp. TK19100]
MSEAPHEHMLIPRQPADFPGLAAYWQFDETADGYEASQGEAYTLTPGADAMSVVADAGSPFGGKALRIDEGQWLNCPRAACPMLDIHGAGGQLTVIAWIKREPTKHGGCEFIAGQWNETNLGRQYGLFLNISVWREHHQVTGHLSNVGGPTPGFKYCIDGPVGTQHVSCGEWSVVAMSYDGSQGFAWLNGALDVRPGLNPYSLAGGLHDGGPTGSNFTVGAVDRSGEMGNFFTGLMAGLAVYRRALSPAEIYALSTLRC